MGMMDVVLRTMERDRERETCLGEQGKPGKDAVVIERGEGLLLSCRSLQCIYDALLDGPMVAGI